MPEPEPQSPQTYYAQQSAITDPRQYSRLFDELPQDLPRLVTIVQGLLIFPFGNWPGHGLPVSRERYPELQLRSIPRMLERILALDPAPLLLARPPEQRLYGLCRDFAVLLVAMLRHQGIPARERVGFAGYFNSDWYWDHRIAEYWDAAQQRWVLVDPMLDPEQRNLAFRALNPLHISAGAPYLLAGEVWRRCRAGLADPDLFVDSPTDRGMPPIRYALLQDFDALNKVELVGADAWHELISKPEPALSEDDRLLLDAIAGLTSAVDSRFDELRRLYASTPYSQQVQQRLALQSL